MKMQPAVIGNTSGRLAGLARKNDRLRKITRSSRGGRKKWLTVRERCNTDQRTFGMGTNGGGGKAAKWKKCKSNPRGPLKR